MDIDEVEDLAHRNLNRANQLRYIYDSTGGAQGRRPVGHSDLLRASVVFLHATLEDFLRNLGHLFLHDASKDVLDDVPIVGSLDSIRAGKFQLGELVRFRGKTVDEVIQESTRSHLARRTISNPTELASFVRSIGLSSDPLGAWMPDVDQLMQRRHQIVHQADRNKKTGQGQHWTSSIGSHHVARWSESTAELVAELVRQSKTRLQQQQQLPV